MADKQKLIVALINAIEAIDPCDSEAEIFRENWVTCITGSLAVVVLAMLGKRVCVFHEVGYHLTMPIAVSRNGRKCKCILHYLEYLLKTWINFNPSMNR